MRQTYTILIVFLVAVAHAQMSGGPDNFGYTWKDSNHPDGPDFEWVDITSVGIPVSGLADDNSVGPFSMPNFHYYWEDVNEFTVGSNGWVAFENISNISYCFPSFPTAGGGDYLLAPFMHDLNFNGSGNNSEVFYYDDVSNNRFIISFENIARWSSGIGFAGSNTFQVILSRSDSSITFQYEDVDQREWTGGSCANDLVIGIENSTGAIGLTVAQEPNLADNYAIKFYYPEVSLVDVPDISPSYILNERNSAQTISTEDIIEINTQINNSGNVDINSDIEVNVTVSDGGFDVYDSTIIILGGLNTGEDQTLNMSFPSLAEGYYTCSVSATNVDDINVTNNTKSARILVVPFSSPYEYTYMSGTPNSFEGTTGWQGFGVVHQVPSFLSSLDSISFYVEAGGAADAQITMSIYDGIAADGSLGNLLHAETVTSYDADAWNTYGLSSSVDNTQGSLFISITYDKVLRIGTRSTSAGSNQSWENLGAWSQYRRNGTREFAVRAYYSGNITGLQSEIAQDFSVYPNPSNSGLFRINGKIEGSWKVFNQLGDELSSGEGQEVDLRKFPSGFYYLKLAHLSPIVLMK